MNIKQWRQEIRRYFPELVLPAEIGLSVFFQLGIQDITNPFGLVFVDVPSSGKTITLNFLANNKHVYSTDSFTAASFVSHASNRKEEDLKQIDLLWKIKYKVFLVRDLAPIFGMRDDDLLKTMGILTRVFDGEGLETDSGLYGRRRYQGDYLFMFLAASTPIQPRVWKVMGNFGSRLFFFNLNTPDKTPKVLAQQVQAKLSPKQKEIKCRETTEAFLSKNFQGVKKIVWARGKDDPKILEDIARLAKLVASLRGTIKVWQNPNAEENLNYTDAVIEKPDRINQSFYNLARGHAVACGRDYLCDEDLAIVIKVALSSAPLDRVRFLRLLIDRGGKLDTHTVMEKLGVSRPTALRQMKLFQLLGLVDFREQYLAIEEPKGTQMFLDKDYSWLLSPKFKKLMEWPWSQF